MLFSCDTKKDILDEYYSFVDSDGYSVSLSKMPERVAVLFSSYVEMWTLAGGNTYITVGESSERRVGESYK